MVVDAVTAIVLIALVLGLFGIGIHHIITRNPERDAQLKKAVRERIALAKLTASIYEQCYAVQDVNPLATWVIGEVQELYGTDLTRQHLRELAGEKDAYRS